MVKCGNCKEMGHNSRGCNNKMVVIDEHKLVEETTAVIVKEDPEDIVKIRKLAEEVLSSLGAGHTESVYHCAMKYGLQDEGFSYESERDLPINFRGRYVGTVRADLIVDKRIVIELKQATAGSEQVVSDAMEQCACYMRETKITTGVVIVFPKREKSNLVFRWFTTGDETDE